MGEKTYYFSNEPQKPTESNSVYDNNNQFINAMLDKTAPTMLMYGGSYLRGHEVELEDAFPMQFPFGLGSPNHQGVKRKVPVSFEECLRHYMRLSMNQFMRPDFILVCYHLLCRHASYKTGIIKCKTQFKGKSLAEKISQMTVHDIKKAATELSSQQQNNEQCVTSTTASSFLKSVSTSCKVLGHTTEAAKEARRKVYALTEYFGTHSIFFTVTPDDECTFIVRMYANMGRKHIFQSVIAVKKNALQISNFVQKPEQSILVHVQFITSLYYKVYMKFLDGIYIRIAKRGLVFLVNQLQS